MIYMDDAIRATIELMQAPVERMTRRTSYNLQGIFTRPRLPPKCRSICRISHHLQA